MPNGPAQERVIEEALAQAGVLPSDVDYLEAHGAGSGLGDPIEVNAAAAVYGRERSPDRPLLIGSVKTNLGHLESAAGVAGLIKVALAMRHGAIPKNLHFHDPNPHLEWDRLPIRVVSETTDWPEEAGRPPPCRGQRLRDFGRERARRAGGVRADEWHPGRGQRKHIIPMRAPRTERRSEPCRSPLAGVPQSEEAFSARNTRLLPLSAKSGDGAPGTGGAISLEWLDEQC